MVFGYYSGFGITYPAGSPEADVQANTIAGVKEACNALAVTAPMTREYLAAQKKVDTRYAIGVQMRMLDPLVPGQTPCDAVGWVRESTPVTGNRTLDERLAALPNEAISGMVAALASGQGYADLRPEQVSAAQPAIVAEAMKRGILVPESLKPSVSVSLPITASTEAKPVNWALIVGGAAVLYFVMRK